MANRIEARLRRSKYLYIIKDRIGFLRKSVVKLLISIYPCSKTTLSERFLSNINDRRVRT